MSGGLAVKNLLQRELQAEQIIYQSKFLRELKHNPDTLIMFYNFWKQVNVQVNF